MAAPESTRKPLARTIRRTDVARLDVRRTVRLTEDEDTKYQRGAEADRVELSEYMRECLSIGDSMKQGQRLTRRTSA